MALDFSIFSDPAGFGLSEGWLSVTAASSYWLVLMAGLLNTIKVAVPALGLTALLGFLIGLGQRSREPLVRRLCQSYVLVFRNIPLLLQLLAIYFGMVWLLPPASEAWGLWGWVFLSKSGLALPSWVGLPVQGRFAVVGGWQLTPEYLAVLLGLVVYTSAFVAEIVRAGLEAVPKGLEDAGLALGMRPRQVARLVTIPVALRLAIPSLSNQVLNLLKNASLGVVVGYPDLVSVSNTAMNQSGRATECMLLVLVVYALISTLAAGGMGWLNRRANHGGLA